MKKLRLYPFLHTINSVQKINATTISERLSRKPHQLFKPHQTDFYMIYLFTKGYGIHYVDFNEIIVQPGNILFMSKGQVHHFDPKETYDGVTIVFTEDFFYRTELHRYFLHHTPLFNDPLRLSYFSAGDFYTQIKTLYHLIEKELKNPADKWQGELLHNYLYSIMLIGERLFKPEEKKFQPTPPQLLISDFKQLTNKHLHKQWTIAQYSAILNISPRTLQNAFAQYERTSPKAWLNERLVLEVKRKLSFESIPINEIAFQLGFKELSNFTNFFKTHTDLTPLEFRQLQYK
ncbi:AraC family transcriptional regulator [Elizabethkingia anophelis]|nr:AraC family transcriptional regulator [Elizabethkingia anophelis]